MDPTSPEQINERVGALRSGFDKGTTRPYAVRHAALKALRSAVRTHEEELLAAMHADMRKPRFEAYMSDIGLVIAEIDHALKHLKDWMRVEHVPTPFALQVAGSVVHREPLGVVLIIAPWNYPVLLLLSPLVGAIAAGNTVLLKPSEDAPHTAAAVEKIISEAFASEHVAVVQGPGQVVGTYMLEHFRFDHIFFTGSPVVGRQIMSLAAQHLTPVTLELGGKCPAIVDRKANVNVAARRIAWSKYFNAGQTCITTDHALVHADVMDEFLEAFAKHVRAFFGEDPQRSPHFARMIHAQRFETVKGYLSQGEIKLGGQHDLSDLYIAPSVLMNVPEGNSVLAEEIFGPLLPVIPWAEREEVLAIIRRNPFPLAAYIFSSDRRAQEYFRDRVPFGGGCINHCMLQFGNAALPFGGAGTSGTGRYHGHHSFERFSNHKGMVTASTLIDHGLPYAPYSSIKEKILRRTLR